MDSILPALVSAAPQLGVAGVLLTILGLLLRQSSEDRSDYRASLADAAKRHAAEMSERETRHNEELEELRGDIKELRKQVDELQAALDLERAARRKAEDMAAEALRRKRPAS